MWSIRHEFEQKNNELLRQYQAGEIEEALWKQEKELNKNIWKSVSAISRIIMQRPMLYVITGMQDSGGADQLGRDSATDYASQAADAVVSTMDGLVSNISDALAGNVVDWRNWGVQFSGKFQNSDECSHC